MAEKLFRFVPLSDLHAAQVRCKPKPKGDG
jgi:hypothetical protein